MVAQMVDEFAVYVEMSDDEAERHAERAAKLAGPHITIHDETHALGGGAHQFPIDDVRVVFEYDPDSDLDYIEQFDSADEYDEWCEREGALNTRTRFVSMRPETRQFDGLRFEPYYDPKPSPAVTAADGTVLRWYDHGRWLTTGEYYAIRFLPNFGKPGAVRLAHKSEIHETYDEYISGSGDRSNYVSFYAKIEVWTGDEWETVDGIGGIDFYEYGNEDIPYADDPYSLSDLKRKSYKWVASDYFGIDFDQVPD